MIKEKQHNQRCLYFPNRIMEVMGGIVDHPLTVVEAPMGYGKTTAVREYLNNAKVHGLWQSVYDGATGNFWSGFCKLFAELDDACSVNLAGLGLPDDSISRQEALELIEGISLPGKTVLVFDDYHLIQNADIHHFIDFLVKNEIADLHIVLIARLASLESLDELKLKGYAHHITKETFELTPDEISKYYKLCGINLKAEQINRLYAYTEGWISALYLLMLNYIKEGSFEEAPGLQASLAPNIYNLVEKAIYTPLSEDLKDFLLTISIFDSFTAEQAAYVWQRPNTAPLLAEILAINAFLTYDPKTEAYRLHHILTTYLRNKLDGTSSVHQQDLYQKAGQWHLQSGDYLEAMQCFYRSGDFDSLLAALEMDKTDSIDGEHRETLIQYFEECSREALANHPTALGFIGRCMFHFNEREQYARVCREFTYFIETNVNLDQRQKDKFSGEYERLLLQASFNDIAEMARHHRKSCELLQRISSANDLTESLALYGSPSGLYLFYRESGKLEQTVSDVLEAMSYYTDVTNDARQTAGHIMAAERHFLMGEFEDAEIIMHRIFHTGNPEYLPGFIVRGLFLQARLALVKGDFETVLSMLKRMREDIHQKKIYLFMHSLDLCEAFIYAHLSQKTRIPLWIAAGEFKKTRLFFPVMGFVNIVYGRVLLINGEYAKLIGNADHFIKIASFFPNILGQIYAYIQLAAAFQQIYRHSEAISALKRALDLAMPDRMVMPFVENCDYIKPLLEQLYREGLYRDDISRILKLAAAYLEAAAAIKEHFSGKKPELTERELEIAQLAAEGLTNKAIGARLFISENTVKTQLKSAFEKLGVKSRVLLRQALY